MKVSVNICTFNRVLHLNETLNALCAVALPGGISAELLIIDNGSTDETATAAQLSRRSSFDIRYYRETRRGKGYAYNRALAESKGDLIVFVDDDVRPGPDWLKNLCMPIVSGKADAVAGWVIIPPELRRPWMTDEHRSFLASTEQWDPKRVEAMNGANMAFSRRVLEKVPGFDPELGPGALGFWDEALFSRQLMKAGYRIIGAPDAWVEHHFEVSRLLRSSFLDRAKREGRSVAYVAWHWNHDDAIPNLTKLIWRKRMKLLLTRFLKPRECAIVEGCAHWEMNLCQQISYFSGMAIEQRRPRLYEKQGFSRASPRD